ncbi:MAG TPA: HlyD family secretion protein [Gemmataceae bacterium]|nr:HlyD family secretion protein [Gemmataceae bacterium]
MENPSDRCPEGVTEAKPDPPEVLPVEAVEHLPAAPAAPAAHPDQRADGSTAAPRSARPPRRAAARPHSLAWIKWLVLGVVGVVALVVGARFLIPWAWTALNTVSTDDAYVNSHVTFVAPRVAGQVAEVLVDDNYRVKKGDVLVRLDKEPLQDQVNIKKAAVDVAEANLAAAQAQARGLVAQTRANRFKMEHSIEDVKNQIANLAAAVATLNSKKANLELAEANLKRGKELAPTGGISKEDLDVRQQTVKADQAAVEQALQQVYAIRVGLGLPERPPKGDDLTAVPPELDQNFSVVRQALATLLQSAAQLGYFPTTWDATPTRAKEDFYKQDAKGDLDTIYTELVRKAPIVKQAKANLMEAQSDLDQALLNLRYTEVVSEIDGVVTRRNVNPGNNVQVGQNLMAVRSLTEIWIDANFKETQLAYLRIGQRVRCEVDMYGSRREFEGRITGFTMGTGETLSLLPPQNATGNFVKIVQRLPVRIELTDYDPDKVPLFVGLSVEPYVYYKEPLDDKIPNAGAFLQPVAPLPQGPTEPKR